MEQISENVVEEFRSQFEGRRDYLVKEISTKTVELNSINRVLNALNGKEANGNKVAISWVEEIEKAIRTFDHGAIITATDIKNRLKQRLGDVTVTQFTNFSTYVKNCAAKRKSLIEDQGEGRGKTYRVNKV